MPTTLALPNGAHALIRDPEAISQRARRPFEKAKTQMALLVGEQDDKLPESEIALILTRKLIETDQWELADEMNDLMILMFVESWSFEGPVTRDALIDLPGNAYSALMEHCRPMLDRVFLRSDYNEADTEKVGPTGASSG